MKRLTSSEARSAFPGAVDAGVTLFETMAALAILALSASLVTITLLPRQPEQELERIAEQLALNLQAAGAEAQIAGESIELVVLENGYRIPALGREVEWATSVEAQWRSATPDGWRTTSRLSLTGPSLTARETRIELSLGDQARSVRVEALSARVSHD